MNIFGILILAFSFVPSFSYGATLDRAVVEVNRTTYTQRQLEVYFLTKYSYENKQGLIKDLSTYALSQKNWTERLSEFSRDKVLQKEAEKSGSFLPSEEKLTEVSEDLYLFIETNESLKGEIRRLAITNLDIVDALSSVLRVQSYLKSRSKTLSSERKKKKWLSDIVANSVIRFYESAQEFKALDLSALHKIKSSPEEKK